MAGFCHFSCGSHKIMGTEMLLVCGEDTNRSGQLEHSIPENLASFYGTWVEILPLFYSAVI